MPLVVEDGTGVAKADSWISQADADEYWEARAQPEWMAADPDERERKLREAADYLKIAFRWPGQQTTIAQSLPWPRAGVPSGGGTFPTNSIPSQVISAQLVLAVEALGGSLLRKPAPERQVIEEASNVKGISRTRKYAPAPVDDSTGLPRFAAVEQILQGIALPNTSEGFAISRLRRVL